MVTRMHGSVLDGMEALPVSVEARFGPALRASEIRLVGMAETSVKEGMLRARTAVWPLVRSVAANSGQGVLVNLAPADLKKTGRSLDLSLALVYASLVLGLEAQRAGELLLLGELALSGAVLPITGVLPHLFAAKGRGLRGVILPEQNLPEARLVTDLDLYPVRHVSDALAIFQGEGAPDLGPRGRPQRVAPAGSPDLSEVRGQHHARRALEIAAAGEHNILFEGPPGAGKTMLARRLPSILPPLLESEALEVAGIQSLVRRITPEQLFARPFRAPHHTATPAGLIGGGAPLIPGELTLAHRGVLFLDELPEFDRRALEVLREPLEERVIHLTRAGRARSFPADFLCVAAMNPCPCGYHGIDASRCRCTPLRVLSYRARLSGPLLDRFDMRLVLPPLAPEDLLQGPGGESSAVVLERVLAARERQLARSGTTNARLGEEALQALGTLPPAERRLLARAVRDGGLSARGLRRIQRLARTIADLADAPKIEAPHLLEALAFRVSAGGDRVSASG